MKRLALGVIGALTLLLGDPATGTPALQSTTDSNRFPTNDKKYRTPRWHPQVLVDVHREASTNTIVSNVQGNMAMAVDRRNAVHLIGKDSTPDLLFQYYTSAHDKRKATGFSDPEPVAATPDIIDKSSGRFDLAVGPPPSGSTDTRDIVHLVYEGRPELQGAMGNDLYYRRRTAAGWQARVNLTHIINDPRYDTRYSVPRIAVDNNGQAHIVAAYWQMFRPPFPGVATDTKDMAHLLIDQAGTMASISHVAFPNYDLGSPLISIGSTVHVAWIQYDPPGTPSPLLHIYHKDLSTPGVTPDEIATAATLGELAFSADAYPAAFDDTHFIWTTNGIVKYLRRTGAGQKQAVESVSQLPNPLSPRIAVDGQHQPHVIWLEDGKFCYAGRVNNPNNPGPDYWKGRQEPSEDFNDYGDGQGFSWLNDFFINRNGGLFINGASARYSNPPCFTRSMEFNLGEQDPSGMVPVGVNAHANLTNGNLLMDFPVFSSSGAGLSTRVRLVWNSQNWEPTPISQGWSHNYYVYLVDSRCGVKDLVQAEAGVTDPKAADIITLFMGDGRSIVFKWKDTDPGGNAKYHVAFDEFGYFARIERLTDDVKTEYKLTTKYGVVYTFRDDGRLREVKDPSGNIETLNYNNSRLSSVVDTMARTTNFVYDGEGNLTQINTAKDGVQNKLDYDASKKLSTLTRNSTGAATDKPVWQFEYHAANDHANHKVVNLISKVTTPFPADFQYFYYQDNRYQHTQEPTLSVPSMDATSARTVTYKDPITFAPPPTDEPRAELMDRRANLWKFVYETRKGLVLKVTDPSGKFVSREFNNDYRNLTKFTDQESNVTTYTYTYQGGTQEKPLYIKDNLRTVTRPSPNQPSGNLPATVATETYTYVDDLSAVATLVTPTPAGGSGTVTRTYQRDGDGNLQGLHYPGTSNRVTGAAQNPIDGYTYDSRGQVKTATRPRGGLSDVTADPTTGLPYSITAPDHGKGTQIRYDGMGFVTSTVTPEGGTTTFHLDGLHRIYQKDDPSGDAGIGLTSFKYELTTGQITQIDFPNGGQTQNTYDQLGRLVETTVRKTAGVTLTTKYRYDPEGNLRQVTDPNNNVTTKTYNSRNELTQSVRSGSGDLSITTQYFYTAAGHLDREVTGGDPTKYVFNAWGAIKKRTYPITAITDDYTYGADGTLQSVVRNASGAFKGGTQYVYDEIGRLCGTAQMASSGTGAHLTTTYGLDLDGNTTEVKDPLGRVYSATYDLAGRPIDTKNAGGVLVSHRDYDDNDRVKTVKGIDPSRGTGTVTLASYAYNARNEVKTAKDALLNTTQYTYYVGGEIDTVTDAVGVITKHQHNLLSQPTQVTRDFGGMNLLTQMDYDGNGNLIKVIDPRVKQTTYTYSNLNQLKSITYPGGNTESWVFDSKGRSQTHNGRRGIVATYTYDLMDRRTGALYTQSGATIGNVQASYDGGSNVSEVLDVSTQVSHTTAYDVFNRLATKQIILGRTGLGSGGTLWKSASYTYKNDSQVDTYTNPAGQVFQHTYETQGNGLLQSITKTSPAVKTYVTYFYDPAGRRTEALFGNTTSTLWDRDGKGRISKVRSVDSTGKTLSSFAYTYNSRNERTNVLMAHLSASVDYTYDNASRLLTENWPGNIAGVDPYTNQLITGGPGNESIKTSAATTTPVAPLAVQPYSATYHYDASGNRDTRQVTYNAATTNYTYGYDDESRLTSETQSTGSVTTSIAYGYGSPASSPNILTRTVGTATPSAQQDTYAYDYANRLTGYVRKVNGTIQSNYSYQFLPSGERLNKVNLLTSTNNEEWFFPDDADVTADYTKSTGSPTYTLASTYVNGGAIDSKAARIMASGTELYYLVDGLGSVHRVIDQAQAVKNTVLTTAWGESLPGFGGVIGTPDRYGFTQREKDAESGLMQFRARAYDPRIGRFIQTDPIIGNRPYEHYAYAGNNPVNKIDPRGLQQESLEDKAAKFSRMSKGAFTSLSDLDQNTLMPLGDEKLGALFPDYGKWKASLPAPAPAAPPPSRADIERAVKARGHQLVERNGQLYELHPGGMIDPLSPDGRRRIDEHFDEVMMMTVGFNVRHPTSGDVMILAASLFIPVVAKVVEEVFVVRNTIKYLPLDRFGRPTGVRATLRTVKEGSDAARSIRPPGFVKAGGGEAGMARGHLLGKQLEGSGKIRENLVTLLQNPTNSPEMSKFEGLVRKAIDAGETIEYSVTPVYNGNNPIPRAVTIEAIGSKGTSIQLSVINPPGR